eukprot:7028900-Prymnesium_polylepis.2
MVRASPWLVSRQAPAVLLEPNCRHSTEQHTTALSALPPFAVCAQCHFMSMLWFRALGAYEYAMRVDEDVCIERLPAVALVRALASDYAFGLETHESHEETLQTFSPWLRDYMPAARLQPALPPLPTSRILFTNFFVSRVAWWGEPAVQQFLDVVNASGGTTTTDGATRPCRRRPSACTRPLCCTLRSTMCTCRRATASSEARRCRSPPRASRTRTSDGWQPWRRRTRPTEASQTSPTEASRRQVARLQVKVEGKRQRVS